MQNNTSKNCPYKLCAFSSQDFIISLLLFPIHQNIVIHIIHNTYTTLQAYIRTINRPIKQQETEKAKQSNVLDK